MIDKNDLTRNIMRAGTLAKTLAEIGAPVPEGLTTALEFSKIRVNPEETTNRGMTALKTAKNEKDVNAALAEMANAHSYYAARESLSVALLSVQEGRIQTAIGQNEKKIYGWLADAFNELAPAFEKAAAALPDLTAMGTPQWNYSETESNALRETKRLKVEMDKLWSPYKVMAETQVYFTESIHQVYALGDIEVNQQAINVDFVLGADKFDPVRRAYLPVSPYIAFVQNGVKLFLTSDPSGVQDQRISLMEMTGGANPGASISDQAMIR